MNFESRFKIGDEIVFISSKLSAIIGTNEPIYGTIVSVKFTKAKVFYDILDDYRGKIYEEIDSINVATIEEGIEE